MRRMHAGETVDPSTPLYAGDAHGLLATFCGADGALSAKLYEHAVAFAARHGRAFSDVLHQCHAAETDKARLHQLRLGMQQVPARPPASTYSLPGPAAHSTLRLWA